MTARQVSTPEFVQLVLQRTLAGGVSWETLEGGTSFRLTTHSGSVDVLSIDGDGVAPFRVDIYDERGTLVETVEADDKLDIHGLLNSLYIAARRNALNIDSVLRGIIDEIGPEPF